MVNRQVNMVYICSGAPYSMAPTQQTHVPMLMWFSETWQQQNSAQVNCLKAQRQATLSQDNLFPSLLSLLDVNSKVIDPKNDMLNQCPTPYIAQLQHESSHA